MYSCGLLLGQGSRGTAVSVHQKGRTALICQARVQGKKATSVDVKSIGVSYDKGNNKWIRDARSDVNLSSYFDDPPMVEPKQGEPYVVWPVVWGYLLTEVELESVTPAQAKQVVDEMGGVLVDVRNLDQFEKQHAEGAVHWKLFQYVEGNSFYDNLKKVAMAGIAMKATERNPNSSAEAEKQFPDKEQPLVVMCSLGGSLETKVLKKSTGKMVEDKDRAFGRESRSLKACYDLARLGYKNIYHLEGGFPQWRYEKFPITE